MEHKKYCNQCKNSLPISNFNKKNDEEYYTRCKVCQDIHNKNEKKKKLNDNDFICKMLYN